MARDARVAHCAKEGSNRSARRSPRFISTGKQLTWQSLEVVGRVIVVVKTVDAQCGRAVAHIEVVGRERSEAVLIADHDRILVALLMAVDARGEGGRSCRGSSWRVADRRYAVARLW